MSSSQHLLSLINDILELSKVESGKLELTLSDFDLKGLISKGILLIEEQASRNEISITTNFEEFPETITADERKVKQIIFNLLSNAVKFTPEHGSIHIEGSRLSTGDVSVSDKNGRKTSGQRNEHPIPTVSGDAFELSVQNTGIGIRKEDLNRIFTAFDQVENSRSRQYPGTGLGLTLTKQLVELHGGTIWVESSGLGKGSNFRVIFPMRS